MLTDWTNHIGTTITNQLGTVIQLQSLLFDWTNHLSITVDSHNHIFDWTNHLANNITDENGSAYNFNNPTGLEQINTILFHEPGINNITISGGIDIYFEINSIVERNRILNSKIAVNYDFAQHITLEMYPTASINIVLQILSDLAKHKIIGDAAINIGSNIIAKLIKYVVNTAEINVNATLLSNYVRERNGVSLIDIITTIEDEITRSRVLNSAIDIESVIDSTVEKYIDWYDTIIFRFNNYKFEILTNHLNESIENYLKEKFITKTYKEN